MNFSSNYEFTPNPVDTAPFTKQAFFKDKTVKFVGRTVSLLKSAGKKVIDSADKITIFLCEKWFDLLNPALTKTEEMERNPNSSKFSKYSGMVLVYIIFILVTPAILYMEVRIGMEARK